MGTTYTILETDTLHIEIDEGSNLFALHTSGPSSGVQDCDGAGPVEIGIAMTKREITPAQLVSMGLKMLQVASYRMTSDEFDKAAREEMQTPHDYMATLMRSLGTAAAPPPVDYFGPAWALIEGAPRSGVILGAKIGYDGGLRRVDAQTMFWNGEKWSATLGELAAQPTHYRVDYAPDPRIWDVEGAQEARGGPPVTPMTPGVRPPPGMFGPLGYLVGAHDSNADEWKLWDVASPTPDEDFSLPLFAMQDPEVASRARAARIEAERQRRYKNLAIDPLNANPDGSDYHLMNHVDDALKADYAPLRDKHVEMIEWLSKEGSSALGECHGTALDHLVEHKIAEIIAPAEGQDRIFSRVCLTEHGRNRLASIREKERG